MGACCCRRRISVETQTIFVGDLSRDCIHMDALTEDQCLCHDDYRMSSNLNPKTLQPINAHPNNKASTRPIDIEVLEKGLLDEHNRYREIHCCPPLIINHSLSILAKEWAKCIAAKNTIQYCSDPKLGENIYKCTSDSIDPSVIVKKWYDEIKYYNFDEDIYSQDTAHFTQLIWKNTKEMGIGFEQVDNTIWIVVFYTPPGNYLRQFHENVPPPAPLKKSIK